MKLESMLLSIFIYSIGICVFGYVADCIFNFHLAIDNVGYLLVYLLENVLFRSFMFFFGFVLYAFIFRKVKVKRYLPFKFILLIGLSLIYAAYFHNDVYSLTHDFKQLRLSVICSLSAVLTILVHDFYLSEMLIKKNAQRYTG